ncbi:MAG: hypothetical protein KGL53_13245 [Elusimicrobia bacterium]|nr:hypothetical protein [Elusimicrobiota bacterium]
MERLLAAAALAAGALLPAAPARAADPYERLALAVARSAERGGARRVAVMAFSSAGRPDKEGAAILAERLETRLAGAGGVQVVERTLLDKVLSEQRLGATGAVDPRLSAPLGKTLGVDAIVTGTFVDLADDRVEVNARLIDARTAQVLGASVVDVRKEWEDDSERMPVDAVWDTNAPDMKSFPAPVVRLLPDPFRDAPSDDPCTGWEAEVDRLQGGSLELKARYWANRLADPAFDARALTRNPGSEIRSLAERQRFYALVRADYAAGAPALSHAEQDNLDAAENAAEGLLDKCYGAAAAAPFSPSGPM